MTNRYDAPGKADKARWVTVFVDAAICLHTALDKNLDQRSIYQL